MSVEIDVNVVIPEKSPQDKREYRVITLPNKLRAILVHDPEAQKSSAGMNVAVGHFSDPAELPGLAHFLEHMLFLGTEKYPDENAYSSYLNTHGGSSNAFTSTENTNYFFDVHPDHFEGALDRFAQFFIAPLFTATATGRELQAVDNEHSKNLQSDSWRLMQFIRSSANPASPLSKFGTGSMATLRDDPAKEGIDVRPALLKFHSDYYSANMMTLAIIAKEPLDTLQQWAVEKFVAVRNKDVPLPRFPAPAFTPEAYGVVNQIVPVRDLRKLNLLWTLPSTRPHYRVKPASMLSHLLGHEGKGSILSLLKKLGWANGLSSGPSTVAEDFTLFGASIDLTPEGFDKIDEILSIVHQYISLLHKTSSEQWLEIYNEVSAIESMNFRFKSKEDPINYSSTLADNLQRYTPEEVLTGPWLYKDHDEKLVRSMLDHFKPTNMVVTVVSKAYAGKTDKKERWYQTEYAQQSLTSELLAKLANPDTIHAELSLPDPNEFIATDFALKSELAQEQLTAPDQPHAAREEAQHHSHDHSHEHKHEDTAAAASCEPPRLLTSVAHRGVRCWFKMDKTFKVPKATVIVRITCPHVDDSPLNSLLSSLYVRLVDDSLNEYSYAASIAGLQYSLDSQSWGIQLSFSGFNHKLGTLAQKLLHRMRTLTVDPDRFRILKEQGVRELANAFLDQPYQHTFTIIDGLNVQGASFVERLAVVEEVTLEGVQQHIGRMFARADAELLVQGNMLQEEAAKLAELVSKELHFQPLLPTEAPNLRVLALPQGVEHIVRVPAFNVDDANSAATILFQLGPQTPELSARLNLLSHIMREPCFNQLRTNEQLGYLVWSGHSKTSGIFNLRLIVQSGEYSADYLRLRIHSFLSQFKGILSEMDEKTFEMNRAAVAARLTEKDKSLAGEASRHWGEVVSRRYVFDINERVASLVKTLSKQDVLSFFEQHVLSSQRKQLSVLYTSAKHAVPAPYFKLSDITGDTAADRPVKEGISEDVAKAPVSEEPSALARIPEKAVDSLVAFRRTLAAYPQLVF